MVALLLVSFLHGLDLTIVAVAVPSLTNQFKTVSDIGWYSATYGIVFSSMTFFFGKLYTLFDLKRVYMASVILFEIGSLLCTFAPTSHVFILGRAIAGMSLPSPYSFNFLRRNLIDLRLARQVSVLLVKDLVVWLQYLAPFQPTSVL
jgi:MFS family permease